MLLKGWIIGREDKTQWVKFSLIHKQFYTVSIARFHWVSPPISAVCLCILKIALSRSFVRIVQPSPPPPTTNSWRWRCLKNKIIEPKVFVCKLYWLANGTHKTHGYWNWYLFLEWTKEKEKKHPGEQQQLRFRLRKIVKENLLEKNQMAKKCFSLSIQLMK